MLAIPGGLLIRSQRKYCLQTSLEALGPPNSTKSRKNRETLTQKFQFAGEKLLSSGFWSGVWTYKNPCQPHTKAQTTPAPLWKPLIFLMKPSFHAPLVVMPQEDEKKALLCQNTNSVPGSPAPLLTCWGSMVLWEAREHMSGVFLLHWLPCLRDRSTGSFFWILDPLCARRRDHWQELFGHAKLNWAATPQAAFGGDCYISTGMRGYTKYSKAFFFFFFVSRSGEWQRHLSFIQCYYLSCSNLRVNWLLGYEPNPKAAEKFHNCKPSPSLGFQVKPTRMILQLKSNLQVMPATSQLNSMYILYLLLWSQSKPSRLGYVGVPGRKTWEMGNEWKKRYRKDKETECSKSQLH